MSGPNEPDLPDGFVNGGRKARRRSWTVESQLAAHDGISRSLVSARACWPRFNVYDSVDSAVPVGRRAHRSHLVRDVFDITQEEVKHQTCHGVEVVDVEITTTSFFSRFLIADRSQSGCLSAVGKP